MNSSSGKNLFKLKADNLSRRFDDKTVFEKLSFEATSGQKIAVTGRNGSGKSTLLKMLAGVLSQSSGDISLISEYEIIPVSELYRYTGFAAPYLNFYDELTAEENLKIVCRLRGLDESRAEQILSVTELYERRSEPVKVYSSGMKQRLRLAFAIIHSPVMLLLDEPMVNLDSAGISLVERIITGYSGILIIATNEEREKKFCDTEINLDRKC